MPGAKLPPMPDVGRIIAAVQNAIGGGGASNGDVMNALLLGIGCLAMSGPAPGPVFDMIMAKLNALRLQVVMPTTTGPTESTESTESATHSRTTQAAVEALSAQLATSGRTVDAGSLMGLLSQCIVYVAWFHTQHPQRSIGWIRDELERQIDHVPDFLRPATVPS
jgi:hypothetical protein